DEPVIVREQVMRELDEEGGPAEACRVVLGRGAGARPIAHEQPARDLAVATTRECDQALAMLGEQVLGEPGDALGPVEIRAGDEPAQASIARRVARQQHEVWATLARPDATEVLLDDRPMTRESRSGRARAGREPFRHGGEGHSRLGAARPWSP